MTDTSKPSSAAPRKGKKTKSRTHHHTRDKTSSSGQAAAPPAGVTAEEDWEANRVRVEALCSTYPNNTCAECNQPGTRWAAVNLGIFVCIRCSGFHRALGVHISKVKSTAMDKWSAAEVDLMAAIGNARGKALFEAALPPGVQPLSGAESDAEMQRFMKRKYQDMEFASENVPRVLRRLYKHVGYGAYKKSSAGSPATRTAEGDTTIAGPPVDRAKAVRDFYGDSAVQVTRKTRQSKPVHGTFGVVNVPAEEYDVRLAAVLTAFGCALDKPHAAAEEGRDNGKAGEAEAAEQSTEMPTA